MSAGEETLMFQIRALKLPVPEREVPLVPGRRFRWDFVWPAQKVALEVQGGTWRKGAHSSGTGIARDCEKACLAAIAGFRTLFVTTADVDSGRAVETIRKALEG